MKVPPLPGVAHRATLENGLRVLVLENRQAPVVTTALTYRVGARNDPCGKAGLAHFLEHMMFKGSARYGPGRIDAVTQAMGGDSNALTWHDATLYYFQFASDRWPEALAIEADRMAGLRFDAIELERERDVILEEIATAEDDPWQVLEQQVHAQLFGEHPYGRPILGTSAEVKQLREDDLRRTHDRHYGPEGAVLTIAGDVGPEAVDRVAEAFRDVAGRPATLDRAQPRRTNPGIRRVESSDGRMPRWIAALPAPRPEATDFAAVRMATALLGLGRASRLQRDLVDEDPRLYSVGATVLDTLEEGCITITAEPVPDATFEEVEARIRATVRSLSGEPPALDELDRVRNLLVADWMFAHETIAEQALTASFAEAWLDLDTPRRRVESLLRVTSEEIAAAVERWFDFELESVIGVGRPARVA